jgi:DNA-binding transcriptional ArsR family regulator
MADAAALDQVFWALSDATRRGVIVRLTRGPASVSELAQPFAMSLPGFMKHLRVLEDAGLLLRAKEGRTVRCELAPAALGEAAMWLAEHEKFWNTRLDALGRYLYHQEEVHPAWTPAKKAARSSGSGAPTPSPP